MSAATTLTAASGLAPGIAPRPLPWVALARGLGALAAVLAFLLSASLLDAVGLGYSVPGGLPFAKVHPATWLAVAGVGAACLAYGNPLRGLAALAGRYPGLALLATTWAGLLLYDALVQGPPVATTIDTFLLPMALLALLGDAPPALRHRLGLALHLVMAGNAVLVLAEFATGWRLVPLTLGTTELTWDWRPSALLGHPLMNAAATATYLVVLVVGRGGLPAGPRLALVGLQVAALAVFGGRVALVVALLFLAARGFGDALALLRGRRVGLGAAAAAAFLAPLAGALVVVPVASGALDPIIARFVDDGGSAHTRSVILGFFDHLTLEDVLLGPDQALIHALQYAEGTDFGIENPWISFVLSYGALVTAIFLVGLLAFLAELVRATRPAGLAVVLVNLLIATSSLSYGAKTLMLAQMTALMLALLPPTPPRDA